MKHWTREEYRIRSGYDRAVTRLEKTGDGCAYVAYIRASRRFGEFLQRRAG